MDIQGKQALQKLINEMHDVTGMWSVEQMVTHVWQAAKAQAIPEGFVLVPVEPTDEIIEAMDQFDSNFWYADMRSAYKAIVKAARGGNE